MFSVSFDHTFKVLRLDFSRIFTTEDFDGIDLAILGFLGGQGRGDANVRSLYDLTEVEVLTVPQSRFAARARKAPIANLQRVVVAPRVRPEDFGRTYREEQAYSTHSQPIIVPTLADAYGFMGLVDPVFVPVP